MPAVPGSLLEPIWAQFAILLPDHPPVVPTDPLGRHRRRIADRVVFEHVVAALVHGSRSERIASPGCSDRTIRRRVHAWAEAGLTEWLHQLVLDQFDRMIGLEVEDLAVDGYSPRGPVAARWRVGPRSTGASRAASARRSPTPRAFRCTWWRPGPTGRTPSC